MHNLWVFLWWLFSERQVTEQRVLLQVQQYEMFGQGAGGWKLVEYQGLIVYPPEN